MGTTLRKTFIESEQGGIGLLEILVGLALSSVILLMTGITFLSGSRSTVDLQTRNKTLEKAQSIMDMISFDLRLAGSGMPIGQELFTIGDTTLLDRPLVVLSSSNASQLILRINETGRSTHLTSAFDPTTDNEIEVADLSLFSDADEFYICDFVVGGTSGFYSNIEDLDEATNEIEYDSADYATPNGSIFKIGSVISVVNEITYSSSNATVPSFVSRTVGSSPQLVGSSSEASFSYFDATGTAIGLPLTAAIIEDSLAIVEVTVTVQSEKPLKSGETVVESHTQQISMRNMITSRER